MQYLVSLEVLILDQARLITVIVIVLGGVLVLASYAHGLITNPGKASALWGGVPQRWLPLYTVSMFMAAAGYLLFTYFFLIHAPNLGIALNYRVLAVIYASILVPSALWMPLTVQMVSNPTPGIWVFIRVILILVGLAAVAVVITLLSLRPISQGALFWVTLAGSVVFLIHTAVLDAIVWPLLFSR